jgi:hypothetical protein
MPRPSSSCCWRSPGTRRRFPQTARDTARRLPTEAAAALEALAEHLRRGGPIPAFDLDGALAAVGRDIVAHGLLEDEPWRERLVLYRELVVAVNRLAPGDVTSRM